MDNLELIDAPATAEASATTSCSQPSIPPLIQHLVDGWPRLVEAMTLAKTTVAAMKAEAKSLGACPHSTWNWDPVRRTSLLDLATETLKLCTEFASKHFGTPTAPVEIDSFLERKILHEAGALKDPESPDILGYWCALEQRYGGGNGERMARHQLACRLRSELLMQPPDQGRHADRAPKVQKDGVLFHIRSRLLTKDTYSHRGYEFDWEAGGHLQRLDADLKEVLGPSKLRHMISIIAMSHHRKLKLPFKVEMPGGIKLTLYTDKTTLLLPSDEALRLRIFIDENKTL